MKNAHLKKRVLATLVSATVAFGGVTVVAPTADADERVTSEYSALPSDANKAALQYNKGAKLKGRMDMLQTQYGPGWCIDAALPGPSLDTQYEVRKLDGVSGLYGFNLVSGGSFDIHPDIEKASISLTKLMLDDYYAGRHEEVRKKALAMQALVSNNQEVLDQIRGYITGDIKPRWAAYGFGWSNNPPKLTAAEFESWTGFSIRRTATATVGQSDFYLVKNSTKFNALKVNPGEYVTVLVPLNYNIYQDVLRDPTKQRILIIAQPGLDNYKPDVIRETVTKTVSPQETKTVTKTATTVVETVKRSGAPRTETQTVTAEPSTKVVETTVVNKNYKTVERTSTVERYTRHFTYAFAFEGNEKTQIIDVDKLGDWKLEIIDDSNGLVEIRKVERNGKDVIEIVPKREGKGTVRFVITDSEGNRHEYTVNIVNEKTEKVTVNDVTVNNHFFNVGVSNIDQTITVPAGWDYKVDGPGELVKVEGSSNQYKLKVDDGVTKGQIKVTVFEKVNGKPTGAENNYIFMIDTTTDGSTYTRVIGNLNSYILEIEGVEEKPEIVEGADKIEKIEKRGDSWVVTPKKDATGDVVIKAVDKDGKTHTFNLKIEHGTNVSVDNVTKLMDEGDTVTIDYKDDTSDLTKEIVSESGEWKWDEQDPWKVTNVTNGTLVFNVYKETGNGRVLIGTYTLVAKVKSESKYPTAKVTQDVLDRNTVILKLGTPGNKFEPKEGKDLFDKEVDENGNWKVLPKVGTDDKIVIVEKFGDDELVEYTINVTPSEIKEVRKNVTSGATVNISRDNLKVTQGKDLLDGGDIKVTKGKDPLNGGDINQYSLEFVDGANGEVVVEVLNSRGIAFQRYTYVVTPQGAREEKFELTPNSESSITMNSSEFTYDVKGEDVIDVKREGDTLLVTPKDGKTGTATVEIKSGNTVVERYTYTVVPGKNGGNTASSDDYKLSVDGRFTITRINNNPIEIIEGKEWVEYDEEDGKWILVPKGPESIGKTVKVIERRGDVVVRRYNIEVLPEGKQLNFEEFRTVLYKNIKDSVDFGEKYTYKVVHGKDLVTVTEPEPGKLAIEAQPGKRGLAQIEIRDPEGNLVRVVDAVIPDTSEGELPKPRPSIKPNPGKEGSYIVDFEGGSNNVEINICTGDGSCTIVPNNKVVDKGSHLEVDPGKVPDGSKLVVVPIENGVRSDKREDYVEIDLGVDLQGNKTEKGSSELDGKCIASIVGLSAPLLLAIPLGILSQVRIPGLEGLSAQVNDAIRQANDQIQRGLGIYNEDRSRRAAGFQGAFNVANPEMLSLAAGSLGAITLGLFLIDGVLRACGQEEMTSSYKIGEATGQEWMMYGSSGKSSKDQAEKPSEEAGAKDKKDESKK
ncbi:hypothetical protein HMPREF3120_00820 [Corynebacterium sp. HMSC11D10]|uniref:hypothetical protein n=1 Tax=Corynebacterium sp. HMSC11D10 TaxID=1581088 RepID=UPI0008A18630|nr:hypothetical protein [Corynebacterium sp. HMSC11D10]OFU58281.1 hypothetical protein HMPREF3120_00820 [Corynebacterium sp. HMSC11D10]